MRRTSRGDFLRSTLAAGTALTATSACSPEPPAASTIGAAGAAWTEPVLLACACAFEQATSFRRKPQFRASL